MKRTNITTKVDGVQMTLGYDYPQEQALNKHKEILGTEVIQVEEVAL